MPNVTIEVMKVKETQAAVLVDPSGDGEEQVWLPLALVVSMEELPSGLYELTVSEQTAQKKGLV